MLDAHAVIGRQTVAGVGEEIGRLPVVELVANAKFAAHIEADRSYTHCERCPAGGPDD